MRAARLLVGAVGLLMLAARPATAQVCNTAGAGPISCTVATTTTLTIPAILRMTIGSSTTNFGTLSATDYNAGNKSIAGPTITVKANQGWRVQVSSAATFWTATGTGAWASKPLSDLLWSKTSIASGFTAVTSTAATIGSGTGTGGTVLPLWLQSNWSYANDTPGTYSVVVSFTLITP